MVRLPLALLIIGSLPANAQIIRGTVTDASTGAKLNSVDVSLYTARSERPIYSVLSGEEGQFELIVPAGRSVYVHIDGLGYASAISSPLTARTGEMIEIDVRMSPQAIPVQGVDVVARKSVDWRLRPFLDRAATNKKAGFGHIWTRADLERNHAPFISHLIRTVSERSDPMCSGNAVYIDNLPVAEDELDMLVAPEDLEGLEMYRTAEMPADWADRTLAVSRNGLLEFNSDGRKPCMLILVWRKPYSGGGEHVSFGRVARMIGFAGFVFALNLLAW